MFEDGGYTMTLERPRPPLLEYLVQLVINKAQSLKHAKESAIASETKPENVPEKKRGSKIRLNEKLTLVDFTKR